MSLRDRTMRTDFDGGGTTGIGGAQGLLPNPGLASEAAAGWSQANASLTFSIRENLALFDECRANGDWSQCVSHLEGAAVAALKLGDVVLKQVVIEVEKPSDEKIDMQLVFAVMDRVASMLPGFGEDTKPTHIPEELAEKLSHIEEETTPYRRGEWYKLHKDYPHD